MNKNQGLNKRIYSSNSPSLENMMHKYHPVNPAYLPTPYLMIDADEWHNGFGSWFQKNVTDKIFKPGGAVNQAFDKAKEDVKKVGQNIGNAAQSVYDTATKTAKAPLRGAFLSLVDLNLVGLASALAIVKNNPNQSHWNQILDSWKNKFQGNPVKLSNAVDIGKNKKKLFYNLVHWKSADGYNASGDTVASVGKVAAGLAGIGGILAAAPEPVISKTAAGYVALGSGALAAIAPILKSFSISSGEAGAEAIADFVDPNLPQPSKEFENEAGARDQSANPVTASVFSIYFDQYKWWIMGGLAVGGALAIGFSLLGSRK